MGFKTLNLVGTYEFLCFAHPNRQRVPGVNYGKLLSTEDANLLMVALQIECENKWEQVEISIKGARV